MRNVFSNITNYQHVNEVEKEKITSKMNDFLYRTFNHKKIELNLHKEISLQDLPKKMLAVEHYVMNENYIFVGKKIISKNNIIISDKESVINCFKNEALANEETHFVCMPVEEKPSYIFTNDDDWNIYFVEIKIEN